MTFALFGIITIFVCWKWGAWRNWKEYYSTILYVLVGDFVADYLLYNKPLWHFSQLTMNYPVLDISTMLICYPATVILYLYFFPKTIGKQALYMLMWIGIYSTLEAVGCLLGDFIHHNGWNIWYSIVFNVIMFPMIRLHYKKPLWVWPISALLCFGLLWWFSIPLAN